MIHYRTEAEVTRAIRGVLKTLGVIHWKQHQGLGSVKGIPDIIGLWEGRMLAIEVKAPKGRVSPYQEQWIRRINQAGGIAFVARSPQDVIEKLGVKERFLC